MWVLFCGLSDEKRVSGASISMVSNWVRTSSGSALVTALSKGLEPKLFAVQLYCTVLLALSDFIVFGVSTFDIAELLQSFSSELLSHKNDFYEHLDLFVPVLSRCCCLLLGAEASTEFQGTRYMSAWKALLGTLVEFSSLAFEKSDEALVDTCKAALTAILQFTSTKETLKPAFAMITEELVKYTLLQLSIGRRGDENHVLVEILKSKHKILESTKSAIRNMGDTTVEGFRTEIDHLANLVAMS